MTCVKIANVYVYKQVFCYSHSKPNMLNSHLPNNIVLVFLAKISVYELISASYIPFHYF